MRLLITGTSTGIGRAVAEHLLARGHQVWGVARSPHRLLGPPDASRTSVADVGRWEDVAAVAADVERHWQGLDGIVAAAAVQGEVGRALTADPAAWADTIRVDLLGTFHTLRALHPLLRPEAGRRAKLVCFSGGGATKPRARFSAYGSAKTAVVRLVETIAEEERDQPLDINAVAPGAINTRLTDEVLALGPERAGKAEYEAATRQKEAGGGSLERAVALVEWLLSPASDGISGRLISAPWDPWDRLGALRARLMDPNDDTYTLRRVTEPK